MLMIAPAKIKVAIILSGMQNVYERSIASIKEIEKNYKTHIFCHCWENESEMRNYGFESIKYPFPSCPAKSILEKYKNINYKISKNSLYKDYFDSLYNQIINKNGKSNSSLFSQFFSMNKADKLRRNYERDNCMKFDIVIRMRFDSLIKSKLVFEKFDLKKINVERSMYHFAEQVQPGKPKGINDQFAFGPSDLMTYYFDVFDQMVKIANEKNSRFCPHFILGQHLLNGNIPVDLLGITVRVHQD